MTCNLCPRRCNALRTETENINGYCKMPLQIKLARADLHFFEEPVISGKNGSGAVFFSGCSLGCVYCQNADISHGTVGKAVTVSRLADIFKELEDKGAHNINLVSPTHYVTQIAKALEIYRPNIPIVYNSGGYESEESLNIAKDFVDIYLLDFKYIDSLFAKKYSFAADYPDAAIRTLLTAYKHKNEIVLKDGIMQSGVIVRHLLLPTHTADAIKIFDFVKENTPNVYFSIMSQYYPCGKAFDYKELSRKVTEREYEKVVNHIIESGFESCFIQERSSADKAFTPSFDLTGI